MKLFAVICLRILLPVFVLTLASNVSFGQSSKSSTDANAIIYRDCTVPYQLRVISIGEHGASIFALADGTYFKEPELRSLFTCLGRKYSEIPLLYVTLFSDTRQLQVAIRSYFKDAPHENVRPVPDTSESDCANLFTAVSPCPYGYFRATYFRFDDKEHFDYSEFPEKVGMKRVYIKAPR